LSQKLSVEPVSDLAQECRPASLQRPARHPHFPSDNALPVPAGEALPQEPVDRSEAIEHNLKTLEKLTRLEN
jgi:hypothetical protein